jgi:hypothetical protein
VMGDEERLEGHASSLRDVGEMEEG